MNLFTVAGAILGVPLAVAIGWYFEPSPTAMKTVEIVRPVTVDSTAIYIRISLFRKKLCPSRVERRVWDGEATLVTDNSINRATPNRLGSSQYIVAVPLEAPLKRGEEGIGLYEVRIAYICNPVQEVMPRWTPWRTIEFDIETPNTSS
jgi:hypothetical protein